MLSRIARHLFLLLSFSCPLVAQSSPERDSSQLSASNEEAVRTAAHAAHVARQAAGGLTAREREVARLIARGKTNRAIAKELVLSERTVEGYVSSLLAKLSFETRSQIAAWAAEHGLLSA